MIKDINEKIKNNKILKIIIIVLIIVVIGLVIGFKVYDCWQINNRAQKSESRLTNKCNLNGKRLKLAAQIRPKCNYEYKKWYEAPRCVSDFDVKPYGYFIVDNNTKEMQKELMSNMNINVDDYDNAYDLLKSMEDYIISIDGTCDNR